MLIDFFVLLQVHFFANEKGKISVVYYFSFVQSQNAESLPNIVIFLVDDMGWQDTSVPFWRQSTPNNAKYHTPNMERLANQGLKLTQGYAASVCSPSRVSLMTGANPAQHRVTNWTLHRDKSTDVQDDSLIPPKWNVNGLTTIPNAPYSFYAQPLAQLLKNAGYHTISIGKAHFGAKDTHGENPLNLGFDVNIAGHAAGGLATYSGLNNFGNNDNPSDFAIPDLEKYWGKDISVTQALTLEAIASLQNRPQDKPFFLYLSHYAVHTPIEPDNRFIQKYTEQGLHTTEAQYASMIEAMDKSLGDILDFLEEHNLDKNTFILFLSDNGGLSAIARGGMAHQHNAPLSSGKGSAYEGGIRIPMIAQWNGIIKENSQSDQPIIIEDVFPTLLEMAQIHNPQLPQRVDGKSFYPLLKGKYKYKNRPLFWHFPNNWYPIEGYGLGASSSVRLGDWKLIYMHKSQELMLFNLSKDIGETTNLAQKYPKKTQKLAKLLTEYLQSTNAQMPILKSNGRPVPMPINQLL